MNQTKKKSRERIIRRRRVEKAGEEVEKEE
jgi:hypothetical protein